MAATAHEDLRAGPQRPGTRSRRRRRLPRPLRWLVVLVAALLAVVLAVVAVAWPLTPSVGDAAARVQQRLAAHHDPMLTQLPGVDRVGQAIIATEDSRFYSHWGIDALGVLRAAVHYSSPDAGGATLDQQLAKNLWTGDGGLLTKAEQMELALKLEAHYSKSEILRLYLAMAYFGHSYYGLPAATEGYFGAAPDQVTWAQASLVAGLVQAPSAYDPYQHLALAKRRQRHVLDRLVATHVLTGQQADAAYAAPLGLRP
ncbi:MAG: putative Transglycosylase [Frankiales bacterium]|nr:putative Transglycosylase [Frankiales bacterium]